MVGRREVGDARHGNDDDEGRGENVKVIVSENSYFEGLRERLRGSLGRSQDAPAKGGLADLGSGAEGDVIEGNKDVRPKQVIYNDDGSIYRGGS